MIKVTSKVTSNIDLNKFFRVLISDTRKIENVIEGHMPQIGAAAAEMIVHEIWKQHPIGDFMAARTQVDVVPEGSRLALHIHGKPEAEVNDEYTAAWLAASVTKRLGDWHLWEFNEFGGNTGTINMPVELYPLKFEGHRDYTTVFTYNRIGTNVSKYKGEVRFIISAFKDQLQKFLTANIAVLAEQQVIDTIAKATDNKIRPKPNAKIMLAKIGVNDSQLSKWNISMSQDSLGRTLFKEAGKSIPRRRVAFLRIIK